MRMVVLFVSTVLWNIQPVPHFLIQFFFSFQISKIYIDNFELKMENKSKKEARRIATTKDVSSSSSTIKLSANLSGSSSSNAKPAFETPVIEQPTQSLTSQDTLTRDSNLDTSFTGMIAEEKRFLAIEMICRLNKSNFAYDKSNHNKRKLPDSFKGKDYKDLGVVDQIKLNSYWDRLHRNVQRYIIEQLRAGVTIQTMSQEVFVEIPHDIEQAQQAVEGDGKKRSPAITLNEKARMMELRVCKNERIVEWWEQAKTSSTDRQVMDAQHSKTSDDRQVRLSALEQLVAVFNNENGEAANYGFRPDNRVVFEPEEGGLLSLSQSDLEDRNNRKVDLPVAILKRFMYIDADEAPTVPRNSNWLWQHWNKLRNNITEVHKRFLRSGQQQGDFASVKGKEIWCKDFAGDDDAVAYSCFVLDTQDMDHLGSTVPGAVSSTIPGYTANTANTAKTANSANAANTAKTANSVSTIGTKRKYTGDSVRSEFRRKAEAKAEAKAEKMQKMELLLRMNKDPEYHYQVQCKLAKDCGLPTPPRSTSPAPAFYFCFDLHSEILGHLDALS